MQLRNHRKEREKVKEGNALHRRELERRVNYENDKTFYKLGTTAGYP